MAKEKEKKVKPKKKDTIKKDTTKKPKINPIKFIINEIIVLIKSIGMGVFGLFDIIVSFIVSFVSYTYWGIRNIIVFLWKLCFKGVFGELYAMLFSCYSGFIFIFSTVFVDLPMFLYDKCSKVVYKYYKKYKDYQEAQKAKKALEAEKALGSKSLTKTLADYITEKYENLSFVKEARAKKEGLLKVGARANSVDAYGKAHTRVRKANNDKRILISLLNAATNSVAVTNTKEEEEHKIDFIYNDIEYTVTLTAHRKKKKG